MDLGASVLVCAKRSVLPITVSSTAIGFDSTVLLKEKILKVRKSLNVAEGEPVPLAIGFLGWILDMTEASDDPRLEAVLDEFPLAVWFAFGVDLEKYIEQVRAHDRKTGRQTVIFVIVNSVESARRVSSKGADALVVQGSRRSHYLC